MRFGEGKTAAKLTAIDQACRLAWSIFRRQALEFVAAGQQANGGFLVASQTIFLGGGSYRRGDVE